MKDSIERFTKTVLGYTKYRPSYPKEMLQVLIDECELTPDKIIADIGSGTGISSKLFLDYGNVVYGVEPNQAMREAAEAYLKHYTNFHSVNGAAETTSLKSHSIDMVVAATAFHWFDKEKAKQEFKRILKSNGWVVLMWNVKNVERSSLVREYENLILQFETDYRASKAQEFEKTAEKGFFIADIVKKKSFVNLQKLTWEGFKGRLLSSSYILSTEDPRYEDMLQALKKIFDRYQKDGVIEFLYNTQLYYSQVDALS